ncbi:MAG: response regulator [Gemmatimonadaceae bacterium]
MPATSTAIPARTALVVDDEPVVRLVLERFLARVGWNVVQAETAEQALALLDAAATPDLVICDLILPGLSGAALCRRIAEHYPALASRLVLTSGNLALAARELQRAALDCPILGKPFSLVDLERLVDAATSDG